MANQVDRNHLGDVSQSRSNLIPRPHAARKAMQKKQGWSVAVDLDVEVEVVQPHQATGAGSREALTARQTWRWSSTLRVRSVGTSTTCNPPRSSPSATPPRK